MHHLLLQIAGWLIVIFSTIALSLLINVSYSRYKMAPRPKKKTSRMPIDL